MTNEAENDFVWETRAARLDRSHGRTEGAFLLNIIGAANRPNLGIGSWHFDKAALPGRTEGRTRTKNKTATSIARFFFRTEPGDALVERVMLNLARSEIDL